MSHIHLQTSKKVPAPEPREAGPKESIYATQPATANYLLAIAAFAAIHQSRNGTYCATVRASTRVQISSYAACHICNDSMKCVVSAVAVLLFAILLHS